MSQPTFKNSFTKIYRKGPYLAISPTRPVLSASVKGKTILITGGHTGIGHAIASNFAIAGAAHVIILGRRGHVLEKARNELSTAHSSTEFHAFAVSIVDEKMVGAVFRDI